MKSILEAIISFFTALFAKKEIPQSQETGSKEASYLPLAWEKDHPERKAWSGFLINELSENWSIFSKAQDIKTFRSDWSELTKQEQINLFAELICWVTYYECNWNPLSNSQDVGNSDKDTWSVGLLQLSVTDQKNYGFNLGYDFKDLQDPFKNLNLGLHILARQITKYGRILMGPAPNKTGLYWAVLYPGGKYDKHEFIAKKTNAFPIKANRKPGKTPQEPINTPRTGDNESTHAINQAYVKAKTYEGQKETNSKFAAFMDKFWAKVGLKSYTGRGIAGASLAWCALFFFAMNSEVGQQVVASAGAKELGSKSGFTIDWKKNGIPQGAGVWKNSSNCNSESGNHITWADGDCTAEELLKPKATWPGFGGNQQDSVKRSIYCAKGDCGSSKDVICRVFWHVKELPGPIKKSKNCSGSTSNESTR